METIRCLQAKDPKATGVDRLAVSYLGLDDMQLRSATKPFTSCLPLSVLYAAATSARAASLAFFLSSAFLAAAAAGACLSAAS